MNVMDRLEDIENELESAEGYAQDAQSTVDRALDELRALKSDAGQLVTDWKEYLSDNVETGELYEYLCEVGEWNSTITRYVIENCNGKVLNDIGVHSETCKRNLKNNLVLQAALWEEEEANRLARALMFAAFLANTAASVMELADAMKATREETIEELERKEKSQANFAESLKSDLRAGLVRADEADAKFAKRDKLDRLWLVMKRVQSEIEELRGDA